MKKKKPNKNAPLQEQIQYWDKVLELSGFEDIEDRRTGFLKVWSGKQLPVLPIKNMAHRSGVYSSLIWKESQAEYYRLAGQFLYLKKFRTKRHKIIWRLHSEGRTLKEIATKLGLTTRQIRYAVNCLQRDFELVLSQTNTVEATRK